MNNPPPRLAGAQSRASTLPRPRADAPPDCDEARTRRMSLARLALAAGTGEDVAALTEGTSRLRFRLDGKPLRSLAALLALVLGVSWAYIAWEGRAHAGESGAAPHTSVAQSENSSTSSGDSSEDGGALAPSGAQSASSTSPAEQMVVYVSGAVASPGVYTLAAGSRVNDGVLAAGGLTGEADGVAVNLAAPLSDGEHLHIPVVGEQMPASTLSGEQDQESTTSGGLVNLNTASAAELETLPGIGPATASSILQWREENGRFTSPEDLLEISGIGNAKYAKLRELVTAQ